MIYSSARFPLMHANCPPILMLVILNPHCMYTCLICLMDSRSVDTSAFAMCSSVINLMCLEMVLINRMPLINMMSPASVIFLYLSIMVIGRDKIPPLMCGCFLSWDIYFQASQVFPQISSAPLTSSRFSGQFSIYTLSSTIFTSCLWLVKAIFYCTLRASKALV